MNGRERKIKETYEAQGFTVLHRGWPDLLMFRNGRDGQLEVKAVEVKRGPDDLVSEFQTTMHDLLRSLGWKVQVEYHDGITARPCESKTRVLKIADDRVNLTKKFIEAIEPSSAERITYVDAQVRGLGLRVNQTGSRVFFYLRKIKGRHRYHTIGSFPEVSLDEARAKASEFNVLLARWKMDGYPDPCPVAA